MYISVQFCFFSLSRRRERTMSNIMKRVRVHFADLKCSRQTLTCRTERRQSP